MRLRGIGLLVLVSVILTFDGSQQDTTASFSPQDTVALCAYTSNLQTPCSDNLATNQYVDVTRVVTIPSGDTLSSSNVLFTPSSFIIPGPEVNGQCANAADDDSDGVVNDGCSVLADPEIDQCLHAVDDDELDDVAGAGAAINDGCPTVGQPETSCVSDYLDDDSDGSINDGCAIVGATEAEESDACEDDLNGDPTDDAIGATQRVNDGCPAVSTAESGTQCNDTLDNDSDGFVNDGCYGGGVGGAEAETNQCQDTADNDVDGRINDGCPRLGGLPLGAVVGRAIATITTGVINNPCGTSLTMDFKLLSGSTVNATPNEIISLNVEFTQSEGALEPYRDDGDANSLPNHVDMYPQFLNQFLDPDRIGDLNSDGDDYDVIDGVAENPGSSALLPYGTLQPLRPLARYTGTGLTVGRAVLFQYVIFNPGALAAFEKPHPLSDLRGTELGYPSLVVLLDPTQPTTPDAITDVCSPTDLRFVLWGKTRDNPCLGGTCSNDDTPCFMSCGDNRGINEFYNSSPSFTDSDSGACSGDDTAGCVRMESPPTSGTYRFVSYSQSARDADGDGIENILDSCPLTATTGFNPRTSDSTNDPDGDAIPATSGGANGCDPAPTSNVANGNHDGDSLGSTWMNAADNCPLVSNSDQADAERWQPYATSAPKGGPRSDQIGDDCDSNPTVADGAFRTLLKSMPKCIGGTDTDSDGFCNSDETTWGSSTTSSASTPEHPALVFNMPLTNAGSGGTTSNPGQVGEPYQVCNDGVDNDQDGLTDEQDGGYTISGNSITITGCLLVDTDGDGFSQGQEYWVYYAEWDQCYGISDDDSDTAVNDGCPASGTAESGTETWACDNDTNDDPNSDASVVNDGCPAVGAAEGASETAVCTGAGNEDWNEDPVDSYFVNDGCPQVGGAAETQCEDDTDNDSDSFVNDGCPSVGYAELSGCRNAYDGDGDTKTNDGCATIGSHAENEACWNAFDGDGDGYANDGCATVSGAAEMSCRDNDDDDGDGKVNDGCQAWTEGSGAESGTNCSNSTDDDSDTRVNDGCPPVAPTGADTHRDPCGYAPSSPPYATGTGWPLDIIGTDHKITSLDSGSFAAHLGTGPGDAGYDQRWDLKPGAASSSSHAYITTLDLAYYSSSSIPMLNGTSVMNKYCPYP